MKIVAKPINVIAIFNCDNMPTPKKFRFEERGETIEISVDKIIETETQKIAGIDSIIYRCQSVISGDLKLYELKYTISSYSWELYKF